MDTNSPSTTLHESPAVPICTSPQDALHQIVPCDSTPAPSHSVIQGRHVLRLLALDDNVFEEILELLREDRSHRTLSFTCKSVREACKPFLFRKVRVATEAAVMSGQLFNLNISSDIWLHVRHLHFYGSWINRPDGRDVLGDLQYSLAALLTSMPLLNTISVTNGWNGIPWDALKTMLAVPHLQHFLLYMTPERHHPYPVDEEPFTVAPLRTFEYIFDDLRYIERPFVGELSFFGYVVPQLAASLESLRLPLDTAPLAKLASLRWPRLQTLHLWGDRRRSEDSTTPLVAVLSGMPNLRSITLLPAQHDTSRRERVWPDGALWTFSCSNLERLTLSYPDPKDRLFSHLPSTLRQLSLRCWPRHYLHRHDCERVTLEHHCWRSPIPSSSEMLEVLKKCRSDLLEELEVEYLENCDDEDLLQALPILFPKLRTLTLLRYRRESETEVPVAQIAQNLAKIPHLRLLRAHLDLPTEPDPYSDFSSWDTATQHELLVHDKCCRQNAQTLADHLPASQYVCLLSRFRSANTWSPYKVVRDGSGAPYLMKGQIQDTIYGLPSCDDPGPQLV